MSSPVPTPTHQPPPAAPRPVTAGASRRSWFEPRVRAFWLVGLVLGGVSVALSSLQYVESSHDRRLIERNYRGWALITEAGGFSLKGHTVTDPGALFKLEMHLPDRAPYELARLAPLPPGTITYATTRPGQVPASGAGESGPAPRFTVGRYAPVFVNPNDPNDFTARVSVSALSELAVGLAFVPVAILLLAIAFFNRWRILSIWKRGEPAVAMVVDTRYSAVAPLSRIVRFTLRDSHDPRIFSVIIPTRFGRMQAGDEFYVVHPRRGPQQAIVAGLYQ
jgi:hypothetical protein